MYKTLVKPLADFLISLIAVLVLAPVLLLVALVLVIAHGGSPFFIQERPGLNERIFKIIKFKTMSDKKGPDGKLLPDELRLTKLGSFIRKTSLDELPQLINVLKGDMSLIGPRPLLVHYLELYNEDQKKRHLVKPGITGWAQVNGRNSVTWQEKFKLDTWYVEHISFPLDLKIFFTTILKVFRSEGINQKGQVTTKNFEGNEV